MCKLKINDVWYSILKFDDINYNQYLPEILIENDETQKKWWVYVAASHKAAYKASKDFYKDLWKNDPKEATLIFGSKRYSKPNQPEYEFATYDFIENTVEDVIGDIESKIGFIPKVMYKHNEE